MRGRAALAALATAGHESVRKRLIAAACATPGSTGRDTRLLSVRSDRSEVSLKERR